MFRFCLTFMLIFFNKNLLSFDFLIEFRNKFSTESDTTRYSNIKKKDFLNELEMHCFYFRRNKL